MGTISFPSQSGAPCPVHPHTRGDNLLGVAPLVPVSGSPPHAWGQCWNLPATVLFLRFTPTRVGTIAVSRLGGTICTVHPHTRGDNVALGFEPSALGGSPPHAWGQFGIEPVARGPERFTPTRVGTMSHEPCVGKGCSVHPHTRGDNDFSRSRSLSVHDLFMVHPHTRGDNAVLDIYDMDKAGSPPHAWGQYF